MKKLTKEEFDRAINKGLGRAFLDVKEYGDKDVKSLLLNAILRNLVYDNQSEGGRAKWLFSVLEYTDDISYYERALLENLSNCESIWDTDQALDLLLEFAKRGSDRARKELYRKFDAQKFNESWIGSEQIIELDGIDGFLHVAETIGRRLREDEGYWEDDFLLNKVKDRFGDEAIRKTIDIKLQTSKNLRAYIERITRFESGKSGSKEEIDERIRKQFTLERILADIENAKGEFPGRYAIFGKSALDDDIQRVFDEFRREERTPQLIRFLWIFSRRKLPELLPKVFELALNEDNELSFAAISALSNSIDSKIHNVGEKVLRQKDWERAASGFELLIRNYRNGDNEEIEKILKRIPATAVRDKIHRVVSDLVELCRNNDSEQLNDVMEWIYENSPCMNCRGEAVKLLIANKALSDCILNECLVDGSEKIREIAEREKSFKQSIS
ncbi:MAG: hypothetical protein CEE38_14290 [Planctomycetes bacterium B3_Pla]|nr:MAG: hypothetical protein CEE38_14290 [Planctomycetes bacterium B3_Pla]